MKKIIITTLMILALLMGQAVMGAASASSFETGSKDNSSYTMEQIQEMLLDYFASQNIDYPLGSDEFYYYALNQLLEESDPLLAQHKNYDLISAYLAHYIATDEAIYFNLETEKNLALASNNTEMTSALTDAQDSPTFFEEHDFLSTSIGDLRAKYASPTEEKIILPATVEPAAIASYTPSKAVSYAGKWAGDKSNEKHNPSYPYYKKKDCTNFVSQCLRAGGLSMKGSSNSIGIHASTKNWYCKYIEEWHGNSALKGFSLTSSWCRVSDLNSYLTAKAKAKVHTTKVATLIKKCEAGDVVQLAHNDTGEVYHSIIISYRTSSTAKYCAHSNAQTDTPVSNIPTSNLKFVLFDLT